MVSHIFKCLSDTLIYNYNLFLEVMAGDTCVSSLIAIGNTINQLEINVSLITIYCLRLFVVVYKHVTL